MRYLSVGYFPLWAAIFCVLAWLFQPMFAAQKNMIVPLLMLVMLGMGMTLSWQDFVAVWRKRQTVILGVAVQFLVMPLAAFLLAKGFALSQALTVGLMLVGASAGGTASNVMAFLAKGDVALSVSMTLVSTVLAVFMLPFLTWVYLGQEVNVPWLGMLFSLIKLIVLPVLIGMLINHFFENTLNNVRAIFPSISMLAIVFIIAIVVALNQKNLAGMAFSLTGIIVLHNTIGLISGYGLGKLLGQDEKTARTLAIEVGMQNSGLSVALALKYFGATSALPGALFSVWHNVSGSLLAAYWQKHPEGKNK